MTALESGSGVIKINGREYATGSLEMRPFGQSGDDVLIVHAVDGYVFSGRRPFDEFTIDGEEPEDRDELLAWAAEHFSLCSGGGTPQLAATTLASATAGNGQISVPFSSVTNATGYTAQASSNNFSSIAGTASGSGSPLVITGLANGTAYKVRVRGTAPGYLPGPWATSAGTFSPAAPDPEPEPENDFEYILSLESDPYDALQDADDLDYTHAVAISGPDASIVADFHTHLDGHFAAARYPATNTQKTKWTESGTANVNVSIPGVQFPRSFTLRGYHYIVSGEASFNPDSAARVTFHV